MKFIASIFLLAYLLPCIAHAEEMQSLDAWLGQPAEQQESSYLFVRCAGLYSGVLHYAGAGAFGKEIIDNYERSIVMLSLKAAMQRSQSHGEQATKYLDQVVSDRERIASIYKGRMKDSYAATGQAAVNDPLLTSDLGVCKSLVQMLQRN